MVYDSFRKEYKKNYYIKNGDKIDNQVLVKESLAFISELFIWSYDSPISSSTKADGYSILYLLMQNFRASPNKISDIITGTTTHNKMYLILDVVSDLNSTVWVDCVSCNLTYAKSMYGV